MSKHFDVAVIIPTFNRGSLLGSAIESVLDQRVQAATYEIVVVDNKSEDDTRSVIQRYAERHKNVRYILEEKQGASFARNAGILDTTAGIIAFLDDDVRASPDWVETIKQSLDNYSEVLFVGGKVLPQWNAPPPAWLTRLHWPPLALIDYGSESFFVDWDRQVCLVTANLAVRRQAFDRFGLFSADFRRCEDHEFELRILEGNCKGLFVPELTVTAQVQDERLSKSYHRSWYAERGMFMADLMAYEMASRGREIHSSESDAPTIGGVASYVYGDLLRNLGACAKAWITRNETNSFYHELRSRELFNYIRRRFTLNESSRHRSLVLDMLSFSKKLMGKKIRKHLRSRASRVSLK